MGIKISKESFKSSNKKIEFQNRSIRFRFGEYGGRYSRIILSVFAYS
jgi:hypothetical protein